ncbi:M20/M25/M40 family metallo-hydrolase [Klebsiella variicola subsp. variicola]|nr:M20/M25/M40 family metallo-hydrolase [Klebsiella variicola subsp. variicola]
MNNGPGPCFAFNTHLDTVPAGSGWASDPFTLTERDGRLYGRGACDAKARWWRWLKPCVCWLPTVSSGPAH